MNNYIKNPKNGQMEGSMGGPPAEHSNVSLNMVTPEYYAGTLHCESCGTIVSVNAAELERVTRGGLFHCDRCTDPSRWDEYMMDDDDAPAVSCVSCNGPVNTAAGETDTCHHCLALMEIDQQIMKATQESLAKEDNLVVPTEVLRLVKDVSEVARALAVDIRNGADANWVRDSINLMVDDLREAKKAL